MIDKIIKILKMFYKTKEDLDINKFKTFDRIKFNGEVFAVDGGSGTILDCGTYLISKIKVGYVCYKNRERVNEDVKNYYLFIFLTKNGIVTEIVPKLEIKLRKNNIDDVQNEVRETLEKETIKNFKDGIVLADGYFSDINQKNVIYILKTSRLKTESGRSLLGLLNEIGKKKFRDKMWFYEISNNDFVVKFHEKSKFCYRVKTNWDGDLKSLFGAIAYYSTDPEILGYPYPLLKIDKIVRLREDERKRESNKIKMMMPNELRVKVESDEKSVIMHDFLDERAYR